MKALTLTEPWAILYVAARLDTGLRNKCIESRSWCVAGARGKRLGVHAAIGIKADIRDLVSDCVRFREPYASALVACGYAPLDPWNNRYEARLEQMNETRLRTPEQNGGGFLSATPVQRAKPLAPLKKIPLGAMLGSVMVEDIIPGRAVEYRHGQGAISVLEMALGSYDESAGRRFGWISSAPRQLAEPIVCRGFQQLWEIPDDVEHWMREQGAI